jgi:hypothetical protein
MRWIGQHIYDLIARFRSKVYFENGLDITGDITATGDTFTFQSGNTDDPTFVIKNTADDNQAARLTMTKDRGASMADGDRIGEIDFFGEDASQNNQQYSKIIVQAIESAHGDEAGQFKLQVANDGTLRTGLLLSGDKDTADEIDVTIANGAASTTTVAGDLTVNGDTVTFQSANADDPAIWIKNTANDNQATRMLFLKERTDGSVQDAVDGDECGAIYFYGYDDGTPSLQQYGYILSTVHDATSGEESGRLDIGVANHDGGTEFGVSMVGGSENGEVDVTIGSGANSLTTISGVLSVTSALTLDSVSVEAIQTASESYGDSDVTLMTSAAIQDKIQAHYSYQYLHFSFKAQNIPSDCWMSPNQVGVEYYLWNNTHGSGQTQASSGAPSAVDTSATISVDYLDQTTGFIIPKDCKLEGFYGNTRLNGTDPNTLRPVMALFRATEPSDGNTSDLTATCVAFDKYDTASGNRKNRFLKLATTVDVDLAQGDILFPACGFDATANDDAGDIWGAFTIVLKTRIP